MKRIRPTNESPFYMRRASLLLFLFLSVSAHAQWNARAQLDTQRIRIGEQPTLTLTLEYMDNEKEGEVRLPEVGDQLGKKIEVLERGPVDTLTPHENKAPELRRIQQRFRLTSFDSGRHRIPPFHFHVNGDSISTGPLFLKVNSVKLGKTKNLKPIKEIERFPYTWRAWFQEHWPWIAAGGALLVIALLLFLYYRKRKDRTDVTPSPPARPPHEVALERLRSLEAEKAWKERNPKTFYTELTDTLRHYLEERYRIPALETTTARILHEMTFTGIDEEEKRQLRRILKKADLVKFAKQEASPDEGEASLREAIRFVERSIPASGEDEQGTEEEA